MENTSKFMKNASHVQKACAKNSKKSIAIAVIRLYLSEGSEGICQSIRQLVSRKFQWLTKKIHPTLVKVYQVNMKATLGLIYFIVR